ncbi:Sialyltransferase like protein, partial [Thalictrum thalictroides]
MLRPLKASATNNQRRPTAVLLVFCAVFSLLVLVIQTSFTGNQNHYFNPETIRILSDFQSSVQQCVANRGFGLTAHIVDHCKLVLQFPKSTNSSW